MNHDNIARVYDAGTTDHGQPYFVMEYVPGLALNDYCDRHRVSLDDRIRIFSKVCQGVQHAHQKGVIHRDLKPSNVLVTESQGEPVPKIIDFGVARSTNHLLLQKTVYTEIGHLIGTPEYMSPEQADPTADIDTRTDVYSLGVMLLRCEPIDVIESFSLHVPWQAQRVGAGAGSVAGGRESAASMAG